MAFDGITIAGMVKEFKETIVGGKINKIAQPEPDELLLTIKNNKTQYRLLLSASASLPLIYFTDKNKTSPLTAPNFCMLLRKHVGSGKITAVTQPDMERSIEFRIEHLNELGDLCFKTLVVEIMGKHSNIIFLNEDRMILDSIKHVSCNVSSVRELSLIHIYKAMINVPIPMNIHPIKDFTVNFSCNKRKANSIVITILNLSMGTTFDTSPICRAL